MISVCCNTLLTVLCDAIDIMGLSLIKEKCRTKLQFLRLWLNRTGLKWIKVIKKIHRISSKAHVVDATMKNWKKRNNDCLLYNLIRKIFMFTSFLITRDKQLVQYTCVVLNLPLAYLTGIFITCLSTIIHSCLLVYSGKLD